MRPGSGLALALAAALTTAWACGAPAREELRLILLYATCTVRRDPISPCDPRVGYAPHLERLAEESAVFLRHHIEAGISGLSDTDVEQLPAEIETVYRVNPRRLDRMFGLVGAAIQAAGLPDAFLIAFPADHGEALDPDDAVFPWSHFFQLGPDVIRVPLLVRGSAAGERPARVVPSRNPSL